MNYFYKTVLKKIYFNIPVFVLLMVLSINFVLTHSKCPEHDLINPCVCYSETQYVICSGNEVKNIPLDKVDNFSLGKLWINDTLIHEIADHSLGNASWDKIIITKIEPFTNSIKFNLTKRLSIFTLNLYSLEFILKRVSLISFLSIIC